MEVFEQVDHYNDGLIDAYNDVFSKGGGVPSKRNLDGLHLSIHSIKTAQGGNPEFFGCDEGDEELEYLAMIMPEILTFRYGGFQKWD